MSGKSSNESQDESLSRKQYEKYLLRLQAELCKLQEWVKYKGLRVIVVFEGRDATEKAAPFALLLNESALACFE